MHSHWNVVGDQWVDQDPLTISASQLRVSHLFEAALCSTSNHQQDCGCFTIKRYYGTRLFKCNRFGCKLFRNGFESATDRTRHVRVHERPYKCDRLNCEFNHLGFSSQESLNIHLRHHEGGKQTYNAQQNEFGDQDEMELFLLDAIENDNIDAVCDNISEVPNFAERLIQKAARSISCQMLDLLLDACSSTLIAHSNLLPWLVEADNVGAARILLRRGASAGEAKDEYMCIYHAMMNRSPEMIEILLQYQPKEPARRSRQEKVLSCMIPSADDVTVEEELKVIKCLSLLHDWIREKYYFKQCFQTNAKRGCSIAIAKFFLESGVDVNTRGYNQSTPANTALYVASGFRGQRAAELMRFLLESGADPSLATPKSIPIADRPGPRNIEKWFGISWDQLVQESAKLYAASLPATGDKGDSMDSAGSFAS